MVWLVIVMSLTAAFSLAARCLSESPEAKEKAAVRTAQNAERWLKSAIEEGMEFGQSFTLHLAGAYNDHISLTWDRTGEKEYFYTEGRAYLVNYAYKRQDVYLMPQWCRMSEGFTIKLNISGKPTEKAVKFLIVSPLASVRLSDTPP